MADARRFFSALNIPFEGEHASKVWPSRDLVQLSDMTKKKKNKPRAEQEPRSAHGRAVKKNKNKPRAEQEPRSAHGRAVNYHSMHFFLSLHWPRARHVTCK